MITMRLKPPRSCRASAGLISMILPGMQKIVPGYGFTRPPTTGQPDEAPRLEGLDEGKPSTFELPEFLANPETAADPTETEPPTWQRLYVPDAPTAEDEAAAREVDQSAASSEEVGDESELPAFLRNVTLEEKPAVITPAIPAKAATRRPQLTSDEAATQGENTPPPRRAPEIAGPPIGTRTSKKRPRMPRLPPRKMSRSSLLMKLPRKPLQPIRQKLK